MTDTEGCYAAKDRGAPPCASLNDCVWDCALYNHWRHPVADACEDMGALNYD